MSDYDADLLIVGGGPGGLATALHARSHGLSVIVAEPRDGPDAIPVSWVVVTK